MKKITKILLIPLGFGLATAVLGFLTSKPAPAQAPLPTIPVTVTNPPLVPQLASDTVSLQTTSSLSAPCPGFGFIFDRSIVKSGGTITLFTLPAGKVFVATSLDWRATGSPAVANLARTVFLFRFHGGVNGPSAISVAVADSTGRAGGSETFPTGLVLQSPGQFCLGMDPTAPKAPGEALDATLNGFLAPDR
jgi:hypothetical protein